MTDNENKLAILAKDFFQNTKKALKSCKFAALNVSGPRTDWSAWGDFSRHSDALDAMLMWSIAFKSKPQISKVGKYYRVSINF